MKRFSEQFKKKSETIRLRASERNDLRDRLNSYMEYHPLPADLKTVKKAPVQKQGLGIISEPFKAISVNMTYVRSFAGVFAVFMVVGVPIIAEKSVPGDMLYAVKTNITEEVRASLTLSPYAKVEWETARLERRVAEARLLATEGKLTPEAEATVALAVKEHTDAAQEGIASMRETDEDEAAMAEITFASAMEVQSEVLEGHIAKDPDSTDSVEKGQSIVILAGIVNGVRDHATVAQAGSKPSYEKLLGNVESQTTRAYELFESVQQHAGEEEILNVERRLADIGRKVEEAIALRVHEPVVLVEEEVTEEEVAEPTEPSESNDLETQETEVADDPDAAEVVVQEEELEAPVEETLDEVVVVKEVEMTDQEREDRSIALLREALTGVQKLIIFMTDIDVRQNVTIEKLVPVTFTEEERTKKIMNQLDEVLKIQSEIEKHIIPVELAEKSSIAMELLSGHLESITQLMESGNIAGAERVIVEAYAIAKDMQVFIADAPIMELIEEPVEEELEEEVEPVEEEVTEEPVAEEVETEVPTEEEVE